MWPCNKSHKTFFAAYYGMSMNPTLREPEMVKVVPYTKTSIKAGDVLFFQLPDKKEAIIHRAVRVTKSGIFTRGDNNLALDTFPLRPQDIKGKVVTALRGKSKRKIASGFRGLVRSTLLYIFKRFIRCRYNRIPRTLYYSLINKDILEKLSFFVTRPKTYVFKDKGKTVFKIIQGDHIVFRYE